MVTFFQIIYVIVTVVMIVVILLQSGKGGMGALSGGSSTNSVFGGGGAESVLNKITAYLAVGFVVIAIILVRFSSHKESSLKGIRAKKATAATTETIKNEQKVVDKENTKEEKKEDTNQNK